MAVPWYLRYGLSYRDIEELLAERGVEVDHVSVYRWVYVKVAGVWRYVYRAIDQDGQIIDVLVSKRDKPAARRFFRHALAVTKVTPVEVVTDAAGTYPGVLDELIPSAWHHVEQYANNPVESDHSQLKHRLRPMCGLRTTAPPQSSSPDTPSCRISAAATTNSESRPQLGYESPQPSTN